MDTDQPERIIQCVNARRRCTHFRIIRRLFETARSAAGRTNSAGRPCERKPAGRRENRVILLLVSWMKLPFSGETSVAEVFAAAPLSYTLFASSPTPISSWTLTAAPGQYRFLRSRQTMGRPSDGWSARQTKAQNKEQERSCDTGVLSVLSSEAVTHKSGAASITFGRTFGTTRENTGRSVEDIHEGLSIACEGSTPWVRILVPQPKSQMTRACF